LRTLIVFGLATVLAACSVARPVPPPLADSPSRGADLAAIARALENRSGPTPEGIETQLVRLNDGDLRRIAQALPEAGSGLEQRELTTEQKAGVLLLVLVTLAILGGLFYFALAAPLF
jgi:hypothetical protein